MESTDEIFERAEELCLLAVEDESYIPLYREAMKKAQSLEHSGWKRRNGMSQEQKVLNHIKTTGSITVREAMIEYHIQSLTKRISNLRAEGHNIISNKKRHAVTGADYVRYTLATA